MCEDRGCRLPSDGNGQHLDSNADGSGCTAMHGSGQQWHAMPCHAVQGHVMLCDRTSWHSMPYPASPCHTMSCHAMSCQGISCHSMSLHFMARHGMPLIVMEGNMLQSTAKPTCKRQQKTVSVRKHLRPSSAELLECELFQQPQAPPSEEEASQLKVRLRSYAALTKFKRAALLAASRHLGAYEHEEHRALFQQIDLDNSGSVSPEELRAAFKSAPLETPGAAGIDELLVALDSDKTGDISYTEFIAAVMDTHLEEHRDLAQAAFDTFDINGDGLITKAELDLVLKCGSANEILLLGDKDLDGAINFEEFIGLIKRG